MKDKKSSSGPISGAKAKVRGETGLSSILRRLLTFLYGKIYPSKKDRFFLPILATKHDPIIGMSSSSDGIHGQYWGK